MMGGPSTREQELSNRYGYTADGSWVSKSTAAAYIAMGDWALEYPFPLPPKVHMIGALNAAPGKPLPADILEVLHGRRPFGHSSDKSEVEGAVIVSMGTAVAVEAAEVLSMAANLAALKRPVLCKISNAEMPGNMTLDLLEAAYHGTPIVAVPVFGDQPHNADKSVYHGCGHVVPIDKILNTDKLHLRDAISAVVEDPSFQANAQGPKADEAASNSSSAGS
ncbi:hypothetical protein WJX74_009488 [Apatococcus lobatus]|uniref:Uncharacterized protein n=1 Tax=Apatococcus lobatus TaxID=904363 RepID=A0AAW1S3K0_9CHLO